MARPVQGTLLAALIVAGLWLLVSMSHRKSRQVILRSDDVVLVRLADGREVETNRWYRWWDLLSAGSTAELGSNL